MRESREATGLMEQKLEKTNVLSRHLKIRRHSLPIGSIHLTMSSFRYTTRHIPTPYTPRRKQKCARGPRSVVLPVSL